MVFRGCPGQNTYISLQTLGSSGWGQTWPRHPAFDTANMGRPESPQDCKPQARMEISVGQEQCILFLRAPLLKEKLDFWGKRLLWQGESRGPISSGLVCLGPNGGCLELVAWLPLIEELDTSIHTSLTAIRGSMSSDSSKPGSSPRS